MVEDKEIDLKLFVDSASADEVQSAVRGANDQMCMKRKAQARRYASLQ